MDTMHKKVNGLLALSLRSIADAMSSLSNDNDICIRDISLAADLLREAQAEADRHYARKITNEKWKGKTNAADSRRRSGNPAKTSRKA